MEMLSYNKNISHGNRVNIHARSTAHKRACEPEHRHSAEHTWLMGHGTACAYTVDSTFILRSTDYIRMGVV